MNREEWLQAVAERFRPDFTEAGSPLPARFKVSVGFPSKGALAQKHQRIGECWHSSAATDGIHQILISPVIGEGLRAGDVLVHELCHAALPLGTKHRQPFVKLARALGLDGKPTATVAGPGLVRRLEGILTAVGAYPHAELLTSATTKKQTTRQLKCTCGDCGYVVRVTALWLDKAGAPICPDCMRQMDRA